ncbi:MAG: ankyrin repeat domain-containing protein [Thermoanaerobaculia bacterium]|nr:ankyrin repeat domain-containing protein [Thermoanaerobaculia bacterium]
MLKGCLKSLAMLFGFIAIYYYLLQGRVTPPGDRWGAVALGFGMWIVSGLIWNAAISLSNRGKLKRAGGGVQQFEDGQVVAVAGTIRPLGEPLLAPISKRPCVAYEYKMRPLYSRSSGQTPPMVTGEALAPAVIEGPTGSARLLAWPFLESFVETQLDGDDHRENARAYVSATEFEKVTVSSAISKLKELLADDDGSIKLDMNNGGEIDADALRFSEKIVPAGAKVCAIGRWSTMKGGIVPDPDAARGVELIPGALDAVLSKLAKKAVGFVIGALIMAAVIHGIGWLVLTQYEKDARPQRVYNFVQMVNGDDPREVEKALRSMKGLLDEPEINGLTGLHTARSAAVTKLLLDAGANPNVRDPSGLQPLAIATRRGDVESMKLLLDRGADINAQENDGTTALMRSVEQVSPEALRFLLVRRPDLELRDHSGRSALDRAASFPGAREILLAAGAVDESLDTATAPRLAADCGEPMRVVADYLAAIASGDVETANEVRSSRIKARLTPESLGELAANRPAEARCTAGWATPTLATVALDGQSDTLDFEGWVYLRLEPGGWKIRDEIWSSEGRQ